MRFMRGIRASTRVARRGPGVAALAAALALSGCAGSDLIPSRGKPTAARPAAKQRPLTSSSPEYRQCMVQLSSLSARYTALPDQSFGGGCSANGAVKLLDVGVPTTNLGAMTCPLAANFVAWTRYGVAPAARLLLGSELVRVETMGTYNCRPIAGSARLSQHALSNAVDIAGFVLADGRRVSIRRDWHEGDTATRRFLRVVHASACKRFRTVLSPDYNDAHHDHFHFDMGGGGGFCR